MQTQFFYAGLLATTLGSGCGSSKPAADTGSSLNAGDLRVLTYNVHGLPSLITGDDTPERMRQIAPRLTTHDIIGLQEDFDEANHASLVGEADHTTALWFGDKLPDRVYGSGLSMLARAPVVAHQHIHYTTCNGTTDAASDCLASKGFQAVRLRIGEETLDVYNTHLEAGGGAADNEARSAQVDALVESLSDWSDGQAVIFTGDFNLRETDTEDLPLINRLLSEAELERACWAVDCDAPHHIDKILFRSSTRLSLNATGWKNVEADFRDEASVPLSDHPAIEATFDWTTD
jgi:endonuclease/exonuclease/phosphatase family metal-dependent hydrolase